MTDVEFTVWSAEAVARSIETRSSNLFSNSDVLEVDVRFAPLLRAGTEGVHTFPRR